MEFEVNLFSNRLGELLLESNLFPYMFDEELDKSKHPKRNPLHLKQEVENCFRETRTTSEDMVSFDLGSEKLERIYPYYHILEDSPVIRKRGKGTTKTKGSQAKVQDLGKRDYGIVNWNGKTFTKEYSRNVRGQRDRTTNVSHWFEDYNGNVVFVNRQANAYENIHYHYIENILNDSVLDRLAMEFGLKRSRTINTGFAEEYFSQFDETPNNILDILGSFE